MTKEQLERYKWLQREIIRLQSKIDNLYDKEIEAVSGKVKASMKSFPYTEFRVNVLMDEPKAANERDRMINEYRKRVQQAREEICKIEMFIGGISDSLDRQIIQYRYVDGHTTDETANEFNYTKGRISQRIRKYTQD